MSDAHEPESSHSESSGYLRVTELAVGGMGRVDLALRREGAFKRLYAVKRLHPHLVRDADFREMFMEEARIAGLIQHPNVVSVLDVGVDDDGPFLIMDYVDGLALSTLSRLAIDDEAPLPVQVCLRIARDIALGLHAAHELSDHTGLPLGLVHRDLSPQNVLVGWNGAVRITDFGIAKALGRSVRTSTGVLKGKVAYMSPEQLQFEEPDRRSDLFALGVILFELLSGRRLYKNVSGADGARRILKEPPPDIGEERPEVPPVVAQLLFQLLAKEREHRPRDAAAVAASLSEALAELVADEGAIELATWVDGLAADRKEEQQRRLAECVSEVESRPGGAIAIAPPPSHRAQRRSPVLVVFGLIVAAGVGAAIAVWATSDATQAEATEPGSLESAPTEPPEVASVEPPTSAEEATPVPDSDPVEPESRSETAPAMRPTASMAAMSRGGRERTRMSMAAARMDPAMAGSTMMATMANDPGWDSWDSQ